MRASHAVAVWMFELLRLDPALAGDLLEERGCGRSAFWYWQQVAIAVGVGVCTAIREHKLLVLRAIATGYVVNVLWAFLWLTFLPVSISSMPEISMEAFGGLLLILFTQIATGWVIARTHRAHPIPMGMVFAIWLVVGYLAGSFSEGMRLATDSISQPRFRIYFAWYLAPIFLEVLGVMAGAVLGARRPHPSRG